MAKRKLLLEVRYLLLDIVKFVCLRPLHSSNSSAESLMNNSNNINNSIINNNSKNAKQSSESNNANNNNKIRNRAQSESDQKKNQTMQNYFRQEIGILLNYIS